jgi:hypothetical protein
MGCHLTYTWPLETHLKAPSPEMDLACKSQWHRVMQMAAKIARRNSVRVLLVGLHQRQSVFPVSAVIFAGAETVIRTVHYRDSLHKVLEKLDSFRNLSCERSIDFSKSISPPGESQYSLFQFPVTSRFRKVVQQLLKSSFLPAVTSISSFIVP